MLAYFLIGVLDYSVTKLPALSISESSLAILQNYIPIPYEYLDKPRSGNECRLFRFSPRVLGDNSTYFSGLGLTIPCVGRESESYTPLVLLLNYNKITNITYGFLKVENSTESIASTLHLLRSSAYPHSEAAFLPLLFLESKLKEHNYRILQSHIKLNDLEDQLGQHQTPTQPAGDSMAIDFGAAMRRLNDVTKSVLLDGAYASIVLSWMETVVTWTAEYCVVQSNPRHTDLDNRIRFTQSTCMLLLAKAKRKEKRGKILIQVVYQATAQRNAQINIALLENSTMIAKAGKEDSAVMRQIAIEAKKDNASMKTIAILGMLFLPGTFVATVFTLPVFGSDLSVNAGNRTGFTCFWAITVPLTVAVFFIWGLATLVPVPWKKCFDPRLIKTRKSLLG
ncbi:hypothetical protein B0J14DRAFT_643408 [Halenospora varia]|nr:hypothetical protein B0J14DRAFT_643408 [Halenospora varia]